MAIYIKEGEIIEGKKADVIARRAEWKGLKEEPITGKKMTLYEFISARKKSFNNAMYQKRMTKKQKAKL